MEELGALRKAHVGVQFHVIIEEVGDRRVKEVRLKLMPCVANAVEARVVVTLIAVPLRTALSLAWHV